MIHRFVVGTLLALLSGGTPASVSSSSASAPVFSLSVPDRMVTGTVVLQASARDLKVASVKWQIDDWARTTPPPFQLVVDLGPLPHEKRVTAVAYDRERHPLYQQEAILNAGGRQTRLEFVQPVQGQILAGRTPVIVRAEAPPGDSIGAVTLDLGDRQLPLDPAEGGLYAASVDLPATAIPLVARLKTERGRQAERTVLVNGRGLIASSDAHVVEQTVGVYHNGEPLEGLGPADFSVRDDHGDCEIRDVRLVRDTPLALGIAIDTSLSLLHTVALKQATADRFLEQCMRGGDIGFLYGFGRVVARVVEWTDRKETLKKAVVDLPDDPIPGTVLYEAIIKALYQFQGSQGARALILVTDGNPFDDDTDEKDALAYARQSGVRIYALGLPWAVENVVRYREKDENGQVVEKLRKTLAMQPPNNDLLKRLAQATGGRTFEVKKPEQLPGIYRQIERDIRTQYLVTYVSNARRKNSFHAVQVRARRGRVETAAGFFY